MCRVLHPDIDHTTFQVGSNVESKLYFDYFQREQSFALLQKPLLNFVSDKNLLIFFSLTKSYKENFINASGAFNFYYVTKVFCGWDYKITNIKAAVLKHNGLYKELQVCCIEKEIFKYNIYRTYLLNGWGSKNLVFHNNKEKRSSKLLMFPLILQEYLASFKKSDQSLTCCGWCQLWLFRIVLNLIVLGLLAGSTYLVWYISYTQSLKVGFENLHLCSFQSVES